jgi:hypothetical protein
MFDWLVQALGLIPVGAAVLFAADVYPLRMFVGTFFCLFAAVQLTLVAREVGRARAPATAAPAETRSAASAVDNPAPSSAGLTSGVNDSSNGHAESNGVAADGDFQRELQQLESSIGNATVSSGPANGFESTITSVHPLSVPATKRRRSSVSLREAAAAVDSSSRDLLSTSAISPHSHLSLATKSGDSPWAAQGSVPAPDENGVITSTDTGQDATLAARCRALFHRWYGPISPVYSPQCAVITLMTSGCLGGFMAGTYRTGIESGRVR